MMPFQPLPSPIRGRKRFFALLAMSTLIGCIRFRSDAPNDAGFDAGQINDATEADGGTPIEGGDVIVIPPPVCDHLKPGAAENIAGDLVSELLSDCALRRYFANLPPISITHFQECLTAQIGQVMGCRRLDGELFRYPTLDSTGKVCREMKGSHMGLSTSDGDFDAFIAALSRSLAHNELVTQEDIMRVATVFGATRNDIVRIKDAGPTQPCDAPDGGD